MNKYKIYISFILIFVLVIVPIKFKYVYGVVVVGPQTNPNVILRDDIVYDEEKDEEGKKKKQQKLKKLTELSNNKKYSFLSSQPSETEKVTEKDAQSATEYVTEYLKIMMVEDLFESDMYSRLVPKETDDYYIKYNNALKYMDIYSKQKAEEEAKKKDEEDEKKKAEEDAKKKTYKTNISTDITSGNFIKQFSLEGKKNNNGPIEPILSLIQYVTGIVLGIIQVFSGFLMVVTIAYTGFKMVLSADADNNGGLAANLGFDNLGNSSPAGKKRLQEFMQHLMIGTVITFTSTTIARAIFNILTKV